MIFFLLNGHNPIDIYHLKNNSWEYLGFRGSIVFFAVLCKNTQILYAKMCEFHWFLLGGGEGAAWRAILAANDLEFSYSGVFLCNEKKFLHGVHNGPSGS
jgi:hypothetical protein